MLTSAFYITLKPQVLTKQGRVANKKYLIYNVDEVNNKFDFINDNQEFDSVDKHWCVFAGFENTTPTLADNTTTEPTELKLSTGVKAFITKSIEEKLRG